MVLFRDYKPSCGPSFEALLEVVEAPDILYNQTSNDTITMEGASVTLNCEARGYPEPTVTWQREDKQPIVIRDTGGQGGAMRGQNCTQ